MTNLAVILEETVARHRDRAAPVAGTQALTYGTLDLRSSQFKRELR